CLSACENAEKYPSLGLKKKGEGAPGGAQTKMGKSYDVMVIGPVSLDCNIDHLGNERREVGGAVVASGFAAAGSGAKTAIFCTLRSEEHTSELQSRFEIVCRLLLGKKVIAYSCGSPIAMSL